jgi:hypothetical protein
MRKTLHCQGHYNHFGSMRALVELTGARTTMGEQDIEIVTERPELSGRLGTVSPPSILAT